MPNKYMKVVRVPRGGNQAGTGLEKDTSKDLPERSLPAPRTIESGDEDAPGVSPREQDISPGWLREEDWDLL